MRLLQPIIDGRADVVYGSRFVGNQAHRVAYFWHYVGNKLLTTYSNAFTNLNLTDMETCFKVFRREVIEAIGPKLRQHRFGIEPELTARVAVAASGYSKSASVTTGGRTIRARKSVGRMASQCCGASPATAYSVSSLVRQVRLDLCRCASKGSSSAPLRVESQFRYLLVVVRKHCLGNRGTVGPHA